MSQPKKQTLYPVATKKPPYSLQVPGVEKKPGEGIPRRHPLAIDGLKTTPDPDVKTVYDIVVRGAKKFGNSECMGSRKLVRTHVEEKMVKKVVDGEVREVPKQWTYYEMSGYSWKTFIEYKEVVDTCGAGLRALGLVATDRVHIYAATRYVNFIAARCVRFQDEVTGERWKLIATTYPVRNGSPYHMGARRSPCRLSLHTILLARRDCSTRSFRPAPRPSS